MVNKISSYKIEIQGEEGGIRNEKNILTPWKDFQHMLRRGKKTKNKPGLA